MAKFDDLNGGRLSGVIGDIVIADKQVRRRPRKRKPDEWTPAQKAERVRYKAAVDLYKKLKNVLIVSVWKHMAKNGLSAYNLFLKENLRAFNTDGNIKDPTMLKMAIGELPRPFNICADACSTDSSKVSITWENDSSQSYDRGNDNLIVMFYNGETFTTPMSTVFLRKDSAAKLVFPEGFGADSYLFVFFGNEEKDAYSDSWVGRI
jgi:hypothetical protein